MDTLLQDLRLAVRTLRRSTSFSVIATLILALGIGATTAIYTVVDRVVLNPLPYPEPDRIVYLGWAWNSGGYASNISPTKFNYWRENSRVFDGLATQRWFDAELGVTDPGAPIEGLRVSDDYFRVLGTAPAIGRAFQPDEARADARVVVLSHQLWTSHFGGDSSVVGREIRIDGAPFTVVGVMPASFRLAEEADWGDVLVPLSFSEDELADRGNNFQVIGRLEPGVTMAAARADMARVFDGFRVAHAEHVGDEGTGVILLDFQTFYVGDLQKALWILLGATGFVLLLACTNVANLLLARSVARQRELAVRSALGAARRRIVRQLLTESIVLGAAGGALGMLVSFWSLRGLVAFAPQVLPIDVDLGLDANVLWFSAVAALVTGAGPGLATALSATRLDLARALAEGGRSGSASRRQRSTRNVLIGVEAALAMVLLAGAGLLISTFLHLRSVDPGFVREGVLAARLVRLPNGYDSAGAVRVLQDRVLERLRATPGVVSATSVTALPLQRGMNMPVTAEGRPDATEGAVELRSISTGYFDTFGIRMLSGRDFSDVDRDGSTPVAIISESMAKMFWPGEVALGKRIRIGMYKGEPVMAGAADAPPREVIGIVSDTRQIRLDRSPRRMVFLPHTQWDELMLPVFAIRATASGLSPGVLRDAVREADARIPAPELLSMRDIVSASLLRQRFNMTLMTLFAAMALILTSVGVYGVVSYAVARRTREIGVRMALGAPRSSVLRLVVGQGMTPVLIGLGVGIAASLALTRLLSGMLYGVGPRDPVSLVSVAVVLAGVGFLASWVPARRAARVDPLVALREGQ